MFAELFTVSSYHCLLDILNLLPTPDIGIYLNIDVEQAVERIEKRFASTKRQRNALYESDIILKQKKEKYEMLIPLQNYKVVVVDASQNVNKVYSDVVSELYNII